MKTKTKGDGCRVSENAEKRVAGRQGLRTTGAPPNGGLVARSSVAPMTPSWTRSPAPNPIGQGAGADRRMQAHGFV